MIQLHHGKKEIEIMALNKSRYVVTVFGYGFSNKTISIIMELVKRRSLFDVLHVRKYRLSLLHRIRMARHCLRGLVWLHGNGVSHRDIKSLNILVTEDFSCKLTDFGCSKLYNFNINTPNVGTRLWMAPEVHTQIYEPKAADVWSMGLVLYEILNGELPEWNFDKEVGEMARGVPYIGENIISKCVVYKPKKKDHHLMLY